MRNKSKLSKISMLVLSSFAAIVANAQTNTNLSIKPVASNQISVTASAPKVVTASPEMKPLVPKIQNTDKPVEKPLVPYEGKTLDKIKSSGKIIIGVRTSSIPLSYTPTGKEDSKAIGYAIDICNSIAEKYKQKNGLSNVSIEYSFVTAKNRINKVKDGSVDMECGSTTNNADRRKDVEFSIPYYIAGAKILVKSNNGINSLEDLRNKKVAYIKETTMAKIIDNLNSFRNMNISKVEYNNSELAFQGLEKGDAQAFMYDDLILFGIRANANNPLQYSVVGDFISIEPESIMLRKNDKDFISFVNKEMIAMIKNGQTENFYNKWFLTPIPPKNQNLSIPQSFLLKDVFRDPTTIVGN